MHVTYLGDIDIDSWSYCGADNDQVTRRGIVRTGSALVAVQYSDDGNRRLIGKEQERQSCQSAIMIYHFH